MGKTANYGLPKWEKSDFIKMDDFNDAFGKIESALSGHDESLDGKASTSAVTAVQQEVAAAREANCLVKLAGPIVTTTENGTMEFDLSQVDMTKVAALFLTFCVAGSSTTALSVNGTSVADICTNNRSTSAGLIWLVPFNGKVACRSTFVCNVGGLGTTGSGNTESVNWTLINKVKLSGGSSAGATATLFAVKK